MQKSHRIAHHFRQVFRSQLYPCNALQASRVVEVEQTAARPKNGRPLQNLPPTTIRGFVAAVPFTVSVHGEPCRDFRDGTGIFVVKLSHYRKCEFIDTRDH